MNATMFSETKAKAQLSTIVVICWSKIMSSDIPRSVFNPASENITLCLKPTTRMSWGTGTLQHIIRIVRFVKNTDSEANPNNKLMMRRAGLSSGGR